jgi:hypothetical protein
MKTCDLCRSKSEDITHLALYISGSEGIKVCLPCRMILTRVAEGINRACTKIRHDTILRIKGINTYECEDCRKEEK